jgi:hypothetical protein
LQKANHAESYGGGKTLNASSKTQQTIPRHIVDDLLINFKVNYYESKFKMEDVSRYVSFEIITLSSFNIKTINWHC